jgi:hypothetical protein
MARAGDQFLDLVGDDVLGRVILHHMVDSRNLSGASGAAISSTSTVWKNSLERVDANPWRRGRHDRDRL